MPVGNDDVVFDYDAIFNGCTTMGNKLTDISRELTSLEGTVSGLLQNGLVFEKASPVMRDAYNEFSKQMKTSAANIGSYAENFKKIAESMGQSDSKIVEEIKKAQAEAAANNK
ncbi:hypothetical protein ACIRP0_21850 [Streptomyces sp. NPDC101733]|uniref:hypothetical protein n=1 Tax=unclassified Streptomyces TaxID=2593676 RepID=UPI003428E4D8